MKRAIAVFLVLLMVLSLAACGKSEMTTKSPSPTQPTDSPSSLRKELDASTPTAEVIILKGSSELGNSCDRILSKGYDNEGNLLELVGNQTESVKGFKIEIGVIKNGEWLVRPTDESPFLMEDGLFPNGNDLFALRANGFDDHSFYFVEGGSFLLNIPDCCAVIFNCNTLESRQSFKKNAQSPKVAYESFVPSDPHCIPNFYHYNVDRNALGWKSNPDYIVFNYDSIGADEGKINYVAGVNAYYLDLRTLESSLIMQLPWYEESLWGTPVSRTTIGILSEGLFGVRRDQSIGAASTVSFYNLKGEKIIDLSDYKISLNTFDFYKGYGFHFEEGTYSFFELNELDHLFKVTIDKSGNIISEEAVN